MTNVLKLYHCTSEKAFKSILNYGYIYDQYDRRRFKLDGFVGEGTKGRRVGNCLMPIVDKLYYRLYDEAKGVYFRVTPIVDRPSKQLDHVIVLDAIAVINSCGMWHLNTEENFGFVFNPNGSSSPFSGEIGDTLCSIAQLQRYGRPTDRAEFVVADSVPLNRKTFVECYTI